ncbi:hypothetical protein [Planctomyces sp. SH-PL14]|uniref:hypothetical protein n=1 Tax=Planctomyces sp. SH-PL14 TaxID=1632864 RepID=UPI00078B31F8|nr:hypothetical protein [Planctomyces sp. SH-PL14]AMV16485.1 hypothetical protein VT03_01255 [Planctomyces sp. SH-PL14]
MRQVTIFEDEWQLLVDLVDGTWLFDDVETDDFARWASARDGLIEYGLAVRTAEELRATELGHRVRVDEPSKVTGVSRLWVETDAPKRRRR